MKVRKTPQRTCIGCRGVQDKRELLRIVRTTEGEVIVDETGKRAGRGAYVCPSTECLESALNTKRLARALNCSVSPEDIGRLRARFEELI